MCIEDQYLKTFKTERSPIGMHAQSRTKLTSARLFLDPSRRAGDRAKCVRRLRLVRVPGAASFLALAGIAVLLSAVQPGNAQLARAGANSSKTSSGRSQKGEAVYKSQGCDKCHGSQGEGVPAPGSSGGVPGIASTPLTLPAFLQLVRKPVGQMPPYSRQQVSDLQLADVYTFLHSSMTPIKPTVSDGANIKKGQTLFAEDGCSECHLSLGQGATGTGGSKIGPPQLPLSAFISYVRAPTREMPPYTEKVISNEELADIYAFLQTVPQSPSWKAIPLLNHQSANDK